MYDFRRLSERNIKRAAAIPNPKEYRRPSTMFLWQIKNIFRWKQCWLALSNDKTKLFIFLNGSLNNDVGLECPLFIMTDDFDICQADCKVLDQELVSLFQHGFSLRRKAPASLREHKALSQTLEFLSAFSAERNLVLDGFLGREKPGVLLAREGKNFPVKKKKSTFFALSNNFSKSKSLTRSRSSSTIAFQTFKGDSNNGSRKAATKSFPLNMSFEPKTIRIFVMTWNMAVRKLIEVEGEFLENKIPLDCDIYVFSVQECINQNYFDHFSKFLPHCVLHRLKYARLYGRGDRSFISPKFTGIGIFISKRILADCDIKCSQIVSIGKFEGSKGSAGFAMTLNNKTLAFVSSHLPVNSIEYRSLSYQFIDENLGRGLGNKNFGLFHQFHHVFFMGDLNYILQDIDMKTALLFIRQKNLFAIRLHDSLTSEIAAERSFYGCKEPLPMQNFFPTYKKLEQRPRVFECDAPENFYVTIFKKPWYKRSAVVEKIPAYTDRILVSSIKAYEKDLLPSKSDERSHLYGCYEPDLIGSDHSPVFAVFELNVAALKKLPNPRLLVIKIAKIVVLDGKVKTVIMPDFVKLLFPSVYEDDNDRGSAISAYCFSSISKSSLSHLISFPAAEAPCLSENDLMAAGGTQSPESSQTSKRTRRRIVKLEEKAIRAAEKAAKEVRKGRHKAAEKVGEKASEKKSFTLPSYSSVSALAKERSTKEAIRRLARHHSELPNGSATQQYFKIKGRHSRLLDCIEMRWKTLCDAPTLHLMASVRFEGRSGQCAIPLDITNFKCLKKEKLSEKLVLNGIPIKNRLGESIKAQFSIEFSESRFSRESKKDSK